MIVTKKGTMIRMPVDGVRITGRSAQGVKLIDLDDDDVVMSATPVEPEDEEAPAAFRRRIRAGSPGRKPLKGDPMKKNRLLDADDGAGRSGRRGVAERGGGSERGSGAADLAAIRCRGRCGLGYAHLSRPVDLDGVEWDLKRRHRGRDDRRFAVAVAVALRAGRASPRRGWRARCARMPSAGAGGLLGARVNLWQTLPGGAEDLVAGHAAAGRAVCLSHQRRTTATAICSGARRSSCCRWTTI